MAKPLSLEDHEERLRALEKALREIQNDRRDDDAAQRRFHTETKADISAMIASAVSFVEKSVGGLSSGMDVLMTAAEKSEAERERRKAKDEGAEEQRIRDEAARERAHKRRLAIAGVVVSILAIIGTLAGVAIASHH